MEVKVINKSKNPLPVYAKPGDAGVDLRANIEENIVLRPGERTLIPTGIYASIPLGFEVQIRPRSGLAAREGIIAILGTVDSGYRGEWKVILINLGESDFTIKPEEKIAQAVLKKVEMIEWKEVLELDETDRAEGGFGHTGI